MLSKESEDGPEHHLQSKASMLKLPPPTPACSRPCLSFPNRSRPSVLLSRAHVVTESFLPSGPFPSQQPLLPQRPRHRHRPLTAAGGSWGQC